ncbi:MAG: flagellar hook-basal body complex protein FliE [Planctomycetaceae bacterium]|nr:flagellar hook-basal body complex protein FliE [Planctomycetaceae bacterium]
MDAISNISLPPSIARAIEDLKGIEGFEGLSGLSSETPQAPSFKEFLLDSIDHVNAMQNDADKAVEQLATGGDVNAAEVLTAVQKADLSFRMMMQIRNKLVQAYQEIKEIRI